jgi:glyoxylase-like metal-dependent hydrolase (beta-lactamase superfamily II)
VETILSDILTWSWFSEPHGYNFNGLLIPHAAGNICVDPVEPGDEVLSELARRGVGQIILTNRNHLRAANRVRERTGARTLIHPADAAYAKKLGGIVDGELRVGEQVGALTVVGAAGKSPGEVALQWPERKILIVGDAVIGAPPGKCGLLRASVIDDLPRLQASVRDLLKLDFDALLFGDGVSILRGARTLLSELVATFPR